MPIAIALGALVLAGIGVLLLSGGSASAGTSSGSRSGGATGGTTGGTTGGKSRTGGDVKKIVGGIFLDLPVDNVRPVPTPGFLYRIKQGDTGSGIASKAYGPTTPTKKWYKVAAHPVNKTTLGLDWERWFLPRWSDAGTEYLGAFSGKYALIYVPKETEL